MILASVASGGFMTNAPEQIEIRSCALRGTCGRRMSIMLLTDSRPRWNTNL